MTLSECQALFAQEILIETVALASSIAVGVALIVLFGFLAVTRTRRPGEGGAITTMMVLVLVIGLGALFFAFTGKVYAFSGGVSNLELGSSTANISTKKWCVLQQTADADGEPAGATANFAGFETYGDAQYQAARDTLAGLDARFRFVWVFYAPERADDAEALQALLATLGLKSGGAVDNDFSAVRNKPPTGTTRIVYDRDELSAAAHALELVIRRDLNGWTAVDGPFSLNSGPLQVQLF